MCKLKEELALGGKGKFWRNNILALHIFIVG
jgi:hypothetical protein